MQQSKFKCVPEEKLNNDYPWQLWAIGWIAIAKGFLWAFSEIAIGGPRGDIILIKYLLFSLCFIVLGAGAWNFRTWARTGIIILALVDMLNFVFSNYYAVLRLAEESWFVQLLILFSGPVGDILLLALIVPVFGHFGKSYSAADAT